MKPVQDFVHRRILVLDILKLHVLPPVTYVVVWLRVLFICLVAN